MLALRRSAESLSMRALLHCEVERKIGNIPQPFAADHDFQRFNRIPVAQFLHGGGKLGQREMIHTIDIASSQGNS